MSTIVNHAEIRESLELILDRECPAESENILIILDDVLANNAHELVTDDEERPNAPKNRIINYGAIRTATDIALRSRAPDAREDVLAMLDDGLGNNADSLELTPEELTV